MLWAFSLTPDSLKRNVEPDKRPADERKCAAREECLRELDGLGPNLFPVCPAFRPASTLGAETITCTASPFGYREPAKLLSNAPQGKSDADCMERVCRVLQYLTRPLSCDVVVECAHRWNIIGESLDLILEDLNTLPKRLERLQKDYPETSGKCIRWLLGLADAESNYAMAVKEKRRLVYLVPDIGVTLPGISSCLAYKPKPLEGFENVPYPPNGPFPVVGYTCDEYLSYQEQIVPNLANYLKYYPAEVVGIAELLAAELSGLRGALENGDRMKEQLTQARKADEKPAEPPTDVNSSRIEAAATRAERASKRMDAHAIEEIGRSIDEAEALLGELLDGSRPIERRKAAYERLRNERRPGLEKAYWTINDDCSRNGPDAFWEAMQKNPALARIYDRLRFHLGYDMLGEPPEGNRLAVELERIERHLERLEELRSRVRDLIEVADEILEFHPEITASKEWRQDLQKWAEADKPNDYRANDSSNLGLLLGSRGGVAIESLLGKPFERVFRKLEFLNDKTIDGLAASLRAKRDEILQEIGALKTEAIRGTVKPGKLSPMNSPGAPEPRPNGRGQPSSTAAGASRVEGVMTEAGYSQYLSGVRGIVDTMLYGTVKTHAGETVRVDPQQVKERFKGCVSVFLAAWLRWHDSRKSKPLMLPTNPINWPKDATGIFTEIKEACFYTTLAVIHDSIASAIEPNGRIIDPKTEGWKGLRSIMYRHCIVGQDQQAGYTRELIDAAVRVVQDDLIQHCKLPADQQNGAGNDEDNARIEKARAPIDGSQNPPKNTLTLPEYTKAMTAGDTGKWLGIGEKTFRSRFDAGEIKGQRLGRKYRIHISEFPADVFAKLSLHEMTK